MDEAGFDRAIVLLFGKFRYHCCNEDDRLGMIPAVFIPNLEIDGDIHIVRSLNVLE